MYLPIVLSQRISILSISFMPCSNALKRLVSIISASLTGSLSTSASMATSLEMGRPLSFFFFLEDTNKFIKVVKYFDRVVLFYLAKKTNMGCTLRISKGQTQRSRHKKSIMNYIPASHCSAVQCSDLNWKVFNLIGLNWTELKWTYFTGFIFNCIVMDSINLYSLSPSTILWFSLMK